MRWAALPSFVALSSFAAWLGFVAWLALSLLGFLQLSLFFVPFEIVGSFLNSLSADGKADGFTLAFYNSLQIKLFLTGIITLVLSFLLWKNKEQIYLFCQSLLSQLIELKSSFQKEISTTAVFFLTIIFILGFYLRFSFLDQAIRYDESFSYLTYASKSFIVAASNYSEPNNHILHTLLMKLSTDVFGPELFAIRLPGFLFGSLLPIVVFFLASSMYSEKEGLLAAALTSCSSYLIEFSTIGRGYSIVTFFSVLVFAGMIRAIRKPNDCLWRVCIVVFGGLGFYCIPVMVYPLLAVFIVLFIELVVRGERRKRNFLVIMGTGIALSLFGLSLYSPVFLVSGFKKLFANEFVTPTSFSNVLSNLPASISHLMELWFRDYSIGMKGILLASVGIFFLFDKVFSRTLLSTIFSCLFLVFAQRVVPFERVWQFLLPFFFIAAARGVYLVFEASPFKEKSFPLVLSLALLFLCLPIFLNESITSSTETGVFRDAKRVVAELPEGVGVIASPPSDYPMKYYALKSGKPSHIFDFTKSRGRDSLVVVNHSMNKNLGRSAQLSQALGFYNKLIKEKIQANALIEVKTGEIKTGEVETNAGYSIYRLKSQVLDQQ